MRFSLLPKEREYFRLFTEMAANVATAGALLNDLMSNFANARLKVRELTEHEHIGDKIVHDIVQRLNRTFITPLDREDIYDLAATMDEILDNIEAAADAMVLYRIEEPTEWARSQASVIAQATALIHDAIGKLERRRGELKVSIIEVNRLENEGDRILREAIAGLFHGDMRATDIIKWKDVYELLEAAIDECEHVANILESIVLKYN
jgi:predicted phosphate transport protein (TIGR00153 family)